MFAAVGGRRRCLMRGGLGRDLLILAIGLVLGYFFAVYGGNKLVHSLVGRVPEVRLSNQAVILILIALVVVALIFTSRGKK
jgi:ABC-type Mn2+/Zn2+ transport system permease subunit